jgi:hypothetical protein
MNVASYVAFTVGWLKGGHPERFGVAVLLFHALTEPFYRDWRIGDADIGIAAGQTVLLLIFGGLAFRSARWWPLAVTASLVLILLVHLLTVATPVSFYAAVSARVGLWLLLFVILLAGISERWLAGEAPVSRIGRNGARETL